MPPFVDWGDVETAPDGFEPVPKGIYPAVLAEAPWKEPTQEGKFGYYNGVFELTDPDFNGRKAWRIFSLSPNAMPYVKRDFILLGANPSDLAPGSTTDTDDIVGSLIGAPCRLALSIENYTKTDGTPGQRNKVDQILSAY